MRMRCLPLAVFAMSVLFAPSAAAAMYKWVDSKGVVHYSDRLPDNPRGAPTRLHRSGVSAPVIDSRSSPAEIRLSGHEIEQQKAEAKRQLDRQRQDAALLATYSHENEIEAAREREQRRHQETMRLTTAGLAASPHAEDRKKLDALLARGQQEADAINARFDAQKARFRELNAARALAANGTKPEGAPAP